VDPKTSLLITAQTLRAAALYVELHGYYLPLHRVEGDNPDFDWDNDIDADCFDKSSATPLTPAASERGAIAMVTYGWPNAQPVSDDSPQFEAYTNALDALVLLYAPDGDGYGCWVFPHELAVAFRDAAADCEFHATNPSPLGTEKPHGQDR
jgi:hypothetical protein